MKKKQEILSTEMSIYKYIQLKMVCMFFSAQDKMVSFGDPEFYHLFVSEKQSWFALEFLCAAQSQIDVIKGTTKSSKRR